MNSDDSAPPSSPATSPPSVSASSDDTTGDPRRKSKIPLPAGFRRRTSEAPDIGWDFTKPGARKPSEKPSSPSRSRSSVPSLPAKSPAESTGTPATEPAVDATAKPAAPQDAKGESKPEAQRQTKKSQPIKPPRVERPSAPVKPAEPIESEEPVASESPTEPSSEERVIVPGKTVPAETVPSEIEETAAPVSRSSFTPAVVLHQRDEPPQEQDDVHYHERLLWIDFAQSDQQLQASLLAELASLIEQFEEPTTIPASHFTQLALFDHFYNSEPASPPIATLSWQSWLSDPPEIWVRGRCVSGPKSLAPSQPPPSADNSNGPVSATSLSPELNPFPSSASNEPWGQDDSEPLPLTRRKNLDSDEETSDEDKTLGQLFERMHELLYCESLGDGAQYILSSLTRSVPASGILIHIFDMEKRQFVLARARGPKSQALLLARTSPLGTHLDEALRRQETLKLTDDPRASTHGLWMRLGIQMHHGLCCPVQESRRYLGAIELGREAHQDPFSTTEVHALEYVSQQFSDFLADRARIVDDASLLPRG